jgi:hypothetical protein
VLRTALLTFITVSRHSGHAVVSGQGRSVRSRSIPPQVRRGMNGVGAPGTRREGVDTNRSATAFHAARLTDSCGLTSSNRQSRPNSNRSSRVSAPSGSMPGYSSQMSWSGRRLSRSDKPVSSLMTSSSASGAQVDGFCRWDDRLFRPTRLAAVDAVGDCLPLTRDLDDPNTCPMALRGSGVVLCPGR